MTDIYDENKPLYGSKGISIYLKLLQKKYPDVHIEELLQYARMEPYQVVDDGCFFSQKQIDLFYEKIVELTGNNNIAREAGRFASTPEAMGSLVGSIVGLLGPLRYYELIGKFANKFSKAGIYEAHRLAHNKVEIIVTPHSGVKEKSYQCENRMGYWEAVSTTFSFKLPKIEHPKCLFKGDDVCHYIVSWKESPTFILKRIRNIIAIILCAICLGILFTSPSILFAIALPVSVSVVLGLNWFARTLEIRDLQNTVEKLRGVSDELNEQIELNYENSLLVNEIGQVLAKKSDVKGLFAEVVTILHKRLDYDHCLVLLANNQKSELLYQEGYGFTDKQMGIVEKAAFRLNDPKREELFAASFHNKEPVLINSIGEAQGDLSQQSYNFLRQMRTTSLICCPIVYEEESLGVLVVDNVKNKRQLRQRDMNLLMGIASQIASRLHNMRLEVHLRQNQKMEAVGILAGGVAHDFNNILTTILGYSGMALTRLSEDHPVRSMVQDIYHAGERAAALTRQLLAFSRKQVMEMKVTNLNIIVDDMGKMLERLVGEDLNMRIISADRIGNIKADIGQIEQVLMNLVVNARDAMPGGGSLTVETGEVYLDEKYAQQHEGVNAGTYAVLTITDTGEGMSQEVQEEIFEPFFTTKETGKGTGMGLSTVYGIVKQHHGHIFVYSELGQGTTFKIYLPVVGESLEKRKFQKERTMPHGSETILVVDDESAIRKLVIDTLEPLGYAISQASCAEEAMKFCKSSHGKIDLLLSDVIMPGMNGRELAEVALKECPGIKTVLMSGYTDNVIVDSGALEKGIIFINKPLLPMELASKIRSVLDSGGTGEEIRNIN